METSWTPTLPDGAGPKYLTLARVLREAIRAGHLAEGSRLPTVRDLAWRLDVTPGTVSRAYQIVTQEGLLEATVGRGTFVASRAPRLGPARPMFPLFVERDPGVAQGRVDLRSPQLPDVGQSEVLAAALRRMADSVGPEWLDYPSQRDEDALRAAVCRWLECRILGPLAPEDVTLTHGGQNAINLVLSICLRGDRPVVLTEDLSYPGFRYAARMARAEVVGVEMDEEGIRPDALEAACRRHGPQVLCLTPDTQNPTTARMGAARRAQVMAVARAFDLQVIEDECYAPWGHESPALRALAPERVWYIGSFSKSVSAGMRFGFIACPQGMGEAGRLTAQHGYFALSKAVSLLALDLLQSGAADELRDRVQREMGERLTMLVNRLGAFDLAWQAGMPFAWLRLPMGWRASTFARMAEDEGVLVRSADQYALIHGRAPHAVRLAIAGNIPRQQYEAGLASLAHLLPRPPMDMAV